MAGDAVGRKQWRVVTGEALECVKSVSLCIPLTSIIIYYSNMILIMISAALVTVPQSSATSLSLC